MVMIRQQRITKLWLCDGQGAFYFAVLVVLSAGLLPGMAYPETASADAKVAEYDVVVYGGTSAGMVAVVQAARMGKRAIHESNKASSRQNQQPLAEPVNYL